MKEFRASFPANRNEGASSPVDPATEVERLRMEKMWLQWQFERHIEVLRRAMEKESNSRIERQKRSTEVEYVQFKKEMLQEIKRHRKEAGRKDEKNHALCTELHLLQSEMQNLKRESTTNAVALSTEMKSTSKLKEQVTELYVALQQSQMRARQMEHKVEKKEAEKQLIINDRNRVRKALQESATEIQFMKQQVINLAQSIDGKMGMASQIGTSAFSFTQRQLSKVENMDVSTVESHARLVDAEDELKRRGVELQQAQHHVQELRETVARERGLCAELMQQVDQVNSSKDAAEERANILQGQVKDLQAKMDLAKGLPLLSLLI